MNKKAIIFSLIAIGLSGLFIVLFASSFEQPVDEQSRNAHARIQILDDSIAEFYEYVGEAQQIAGREALFSMYADIKLSSTFLGQDNFNSTFEDCLNDSTGCTNTDNLSVLLTDFSNMIINTRSIETFSFGINDVTMIGESRNYIEVESNVSVTLIDTNYGTWQLSKTVKSKVETTGTYDPAYVNISIEFGGNEDRRIILNTLQEGPVQWNMSTFMEFYKGKEYYWSTNGSCLSDRYEGVFAQDPPGSHNCGIMSIVDNDDQPGLVFANVTHMDYQVITRENHSCDDALSNDPYVQVSIPAVDSDLILTKQDATRFNLNQSGIWNENAGILDSPFC